MSVTELGSEPHTGSIVGNYRLEEVIGRGGMGVVYRATQLSLDRAVAVKLVATAIAADEAFRTRFIREARLAASIEHPNILPIYEAGEAEGVLYIAMRLVEGTDLGVRVATEGPLVPLEAARILGQVGAALDAAHALGLVHRDVKPANVLLQPTRAHDQVYLADFGLAKPAHEHSGPTKTGEFVGSLDYLAPEQIEGRAVDARTDVYALGGALHYVLTGSAPFPGDSPVAKMYAHISSPPPRPSELRPDLPSRLDAVVERAMAKHQDDRYASAGALARDLIAVVEGRPIHAPSRAPGTEASGATLLRSVEHVMAEAEDRDDEEERPSGERPSFPDEPTMDFAPTSSPGLALPLGDDFQYVHYPLDEDAAIPLLGNRDVIERLKQRISKSSGGAFLVTGFRGVGKTTVIQRGMNELCRDEGEAAILHVTLNVARPKSVDELLFEVIRRLFEAIKDKNLLPRLRPAVRRELLLAYARTSLSFSQTRSEANETGGSIGFGAPGVLAALSPKLNVSRKKSESLATQAAFLAYTKGDVEHDFLRIVELLHPAAANGDGHMGGRRRWARRHPPAPWVGKLVIVLDELDKLTDEDGMRRVEKLVSGLKNLLNVRGIHFLFVAGPDLHDQCIRQSRQGNSVYESVFGWHLYVPCSWEGTDRLLDSYWEAWREERRMLSLRDHLRFKARGVPRLLLMEFNSFIRWDGSTPHLVLEGEDLARVEFYARLQRALDEFLGAREGGSLRIADDRWRLGTYYLVDWILLRRKRSFTADKLVALGTDHTLHPLLRLSHAKVDALLEHLVTNEIIEEAHGFGAEETFMEDVPAAQATSYRLVKDVNLALTRFARTNEREQPELVAAGASVVGPTADQPWADSDPVGAVVKDRYELLEEVDRGGMGRVYRAHDKLFRRDVAVKLLDISTYEGSEKIRERFRRKGEIALEMSHPNIVRTHAAIEDDQRLGIVMDFVEGISLAQMMLSVGRFEVRDALELCLPVLDALQYLYDEDVARLDLKPTSILIDHERRPIIVDLGLVKQVREAEEKRGPTGTRAVLGTPAYAAPEQLRGAPVDIRADIFSCAMILVRMISGRLLRDGPDAAAVLNQAQSEEVEVGISVGSTELRAALTRALADSPERRFATPQEFAAALERVPEWQTPNVPQQEDLWGTRVRSRPPVG